MYRDIRKIRQCLQHFAKDMSNRGIGRNLRMSHNTVGKIRNIVSSTGLPINQLLVMNDSELEKFFRPSDITEKPIRETAKNAKLDFNHIINELKRPNVTRHLLWQEYRLNNPNGLSYSRFCTLLSNHKKHKKLPMSIQYKGGEFIQVDFCGTTVPIFDQGTGTVKHNAQIFVGVLPASGYVFAYAVKSQSIRDWQLCHIEMYNFFGGVSKFIQPDNLKSAILHNNSKGISITPAFLELATHYDTIVMPARVRKPQDKSMAEISVNIVQTHILAKYRDFKFFSLADFNRVLAKEIKDLNCESTDTYPNGRLNGFIEIDRPYLQQLPRYDFDICDWLYDIKAKGYIVNILGIEYSINYSYAYQTVDVKFTDKIVEIFFKKQSIAIHERMYKGSSIKYEHLPPDHQIYEDLKPEKLFEWAKSIGENTQFVIEYILESKSNYANNFKNLNKIKTMLISANESNENIELAFAHIVKMNTYSVRQIELVLKTKSYQKLAHKIKDSIEIPIIKSIQAHKNIRGADYYNKKGA